MPHAHALFRRASLFLLLTLCATAARGDFVAPAVKDAVLFQWNSLNFTWQTPEAYAQWWQAQGFANVMLAGVKVNSRGDVFVSMPRWKPLVPATVCVIRNGSLYLNGSYLANPVVPVGPLLDPFPSWAANTEGDSDALQSVLGFEIDPEDRIWILDQGKVAGADALPGSIKLAIYDSISGDLIQMYRFPPDQASLSNSFLNDIMVDHKAGVAYISDSGLPSQTTLPTSFLGGLLVYDLATNSSRRLLSAIPATQPDLSLTFSINGEPVLRSAPMRTGADGIALSNDGKRLFWCPLTSHTLYSISTSLLLNETLSEADVEAGIVTLGSKGCASDGLATDNTGRLFFGSLEGSAVIQGSAEALTTAAMKFVTVHNDSQLLHWPDTFGFDHQGSILVVANQLNRFLDGELNFNQSVVANFRIWRIFVDADSYMARPMESASKLLRTEIIVGSAIAGVVLLLFVVVFTIRGCSRDEEVRYTALPTAE